MRISIFLLLFFPLGLLAQNPIAAFTAKSAACLNEQLLFTNQSTGASNYEWDLCQGDLGLIPTPSNFTNLAGSGANVVVGIDFVFDQGKWFGFYCSLLNNSILRLDFGVDLGNSNPTVTNLGNVGNILNGPQAIKIVKDGSSFFGFISNRNGFKLIRVEFGNTVAGPASSFSATGIISGNAIGNGGIDVVHDGKNWVVAITNQYNVSLINFNNSLANIPLSSDVIETDNFFGASTIGDISIVKFNDEWFGFSVSVENGRVYKLSFGNSLFSQPLIERLSLSLLPNYNPAGIWAVKEDGQYRLFVGTNQGNLFRVDLGSNLETPTVIENDLGNFGVLSSNLKIRGIRDKSRYFLFTSSWQSNDLFRLIFPQSCLTNQDFSIEVSPKNISFTRQGYAAISLYAIKDGLTDEYSRSMTVSSGIAPQLTIASNLSCRTFPIEFSFQSSDVITNAEWSFGDNTTSQAFNPNHTYSLSGTFATQLTVQSLNGCKNFTEKTIKIYDPPSSAFDLPFGLICTNNEFAFANNTIDNFDGNLTYQWLVNDVPQSSTRDFKFSFTKEGDQQIKLITAIPGCSSTLTQTLPSVQTGPAVGFSFAGKCEDEAIAFTNQSAGAVSGYQWDFGNGNTSTQQHPTQTYTDYGNYQVSLITTGTNGCASTITKPIRIYSVPQTNFTIDLPPFACSGSASQFNDITPTMPDSNVATWAWKFGDAAGGTALQKNPLYTYSLPGDYAVELVTTTNAGCSNSVVKSVTIFPSPKADFTFGPACVNQGTSFSDQSTGAIKSWLWSVQGTTYAVKNPIHIFKSSSTYSASLAVTGTNNCINRISKDVVVPVPVVADFAFSSTCATKPAVFDEINTGGADPARAWKWDFGGLGSSEEQRGIYTFPAVGNFGVKLTTTRQSGCSYSITKTIPIIEPPQAQFAVALEAGAAPFRVDFINKSSGAASYMWKFGDANNTTSTVFSPSFTYEQLGDYTARLTIENALKCSDTFNQLIRVVVPQINAAISGFKMEKAPGADAWTPMVTIENKSNVAIINPEVYLDISGNAQITEKIVKVIKPNSLYTHTFTSAIAPRQVDFACAEIKVNADAYSFDNRQCVSLVDEAISRSPYPNPARDILMVEWISKNTEPMTLTLYNSSGQAILNSIYNPTSRGLNQVAVDVASLPAGIYFASYATGGTTQNFRFSIIR